jgi:hypothetical protein
MIAPILENIQKSQTEYLNLITSYNSIINKNKISINDIAIMLDEIKVFWMERLQIIEFELEELTEDYCCFLLSGAIYLDVSDYEHYYFKSMGDYHLLYDPFLKMENFFRIPQDKIDTANMTSYFINVYNDTIDILKKYNTQFYILPIRQIAAKSEKEQFDILNKSFLNFLSCAFDYNFISQEEFCHKYNTYEEIENNMIPYIREHLILSEQDDFKLTLREKINLYFKTQINIEKLVQDKSEAQIFLIAVFSWFSQIIDTLLICIRLRINPFIRFNITFHYLALVMNTFIEDNTLRIMIEKTIIFYVFYRTIDRNRFKDIKFSDYSERIKDKKTLNNILDKMHNQRIDIFVDGIKKIETIISEEYKCII